MTRHLVRPFIALLFCLGVPALSTLARAESDGPEGKASRWVGKKITAVEFAGLKRIEPEALRVKLVSKKNSEVNEDALRADIQALFGMGYFDEIDVEGKPSGEDGVILRYRIKERPVISAIEFDGNEKLSSSDLKDVIKVKEWAILDVNKVREDVNLLQKHYEEKGYYLAKVKYEVEKSKDKDDEVKLIYKISDYDKIRIKKITFLNNKAFSDDQLKATLPETREGGLLSFMNNSGNFKESSFKVDLQRLTYWYLDHGYVKFSYENPVVTVSEDKRWLFISLFVNEGEKYSIGKVDFGGDLLFSKEDLNRELKLESGDVFTITERNADIQRLTEKYQDLGYAFVNVIPKMDIHEDTKTVDITYQFEKGSLVYFGEIKIAGNSKTHDKVIRRELRVHEGELFNGTNLRVSKERVERLGYFQPGELVINQLTRKGRDDLVDLEIQVKERSTGTVSLGAGFGSLQGLFLQGQIAEINLLGRGQNLSFQAQYARSLLFRNFTLSFTEPYAFDTRWSAGVDLFFNNYAIPARFAVRKVGFNLRTGYPINDDMMFFVTYKYEAMGLTTDPTIRPPIDISLDDGKLSSVVLSVTRDKRNNRFETSDGNYQNISLELAGLGGDKRFAKLLINNRYYKRLWGDLVFRNQTEYGHMFRTSSKGIPPTEKFYLGGPNNMRGWQFFGLGPKVTLSQDIGNGLSRIIDSPIGGEVEFFSMFELEHPLIKEAGLKFVSFYDIGNTWPTFPGKDGVAWTLRQDWGLGVRWFSPLGPLRFEWAFPIKLRPGEEDSVFQFFIGQPF